MAAAPLQRDPSLFKHVELGKLARKNFLIRRIEVANSWRSPVSGVRWWSVTSLDFGDGSTEVIDLP